LFRLPERSSPTLQALPDGRLAGSHRGFGAVHARTFACDGRTVVIEDRLQHSGARLMTWSLAPETRIVSVDSIGGERWTVTLERKGVRIGLTADGVARPCEAEGFYAIGYGRRIPSIRLVAPMTRDTVLTTIARMDAA
jgi:hypothetical protein